MRLTPALGQQKLYVLVFTTVKISSRPPRCLTRQKPMPEGVGNAVPDIPRPDRRAIPPTSILKLKVKTSSSSSVLVGPLFGS
ncbi:hypothetical protein ACNKHK_26840 [Shigella flexneri]